MNRRRFLGSLVGAAVAPSLVWPFRKFFLPSIIQPTLAETFAYNGTLLESSIEAIELEAFAREIPDLLYRDSPLYSYLKSRKPCPIGSREFRIPLQMVCTKVDHKRGEVFFEPVKV